ncbi:f-box domain protein [Neofusicoccum parvum]|uniref:F-box domain protein n=1 Tax=Neofusicoccum parvum TaxID=310453 RepID=A0ACB5S4A0_9PEZI|nr:f-box domain protein [Neofusicoccum parvum]
MAPCLLALPQELLSIVAGFLARDDLCALRLSCGMLLAPATRALFNFVRLYPTDESIERYNKVVGHPDYKKHIRYVELYTLEKDVDKTYRQPVLQQLFDTLAQSATSSQLKEICIHNIHNINDEIFMQSQQVKCVLRKISALRLYIVTDDDTTPNNSPEMEEMQSFMCELYPLWLSPASNNLTTLVLYQDLPFGYWPRLDFRGVHLPALQTLALGNYCFSHIHQLEFLSTHASTLKSLYLDNCVVVYYAYLTCHLDDEGYPDIGNGDQFEGRFYADVMTWSHIFHHVRENMDHLTCFRIGKSPRWDKMNKRMALYGEEVNTNFNALAYEDMEQCLCPDRYQMFEMDSGNGWFHYQNLFDEAGEAVAEEIRDYVNDGPYADVCLDTEEGKKVVGFLTHIKQQDREDERAFEELLDRIKPDR